MRFIRSVIHPETNVIDIEQVRSNVFEIHGYFPDFRPFEELPADIQAARSLSGNDMKEANAKYAAITDDSDRAFEVLVALGLMEDYSGLSEYDPNETD